MASRPGKYDAVLPTLPRLPPTNEDVSWMDKVDRIKGAITDRTATTLAQEYVTLRAEKHEIMTQLAAVNIQLEAHEQLLAESQESRADGWGKYGVKDNALRLPTGDTVRIQLEPYGQVKDREAFRLWCIANGYERQLSMMFQTMNGLVKERLLAGDPEPDGCEVFAKTKVVFAKKGSTE